MLQKTTIVGDHKKGYIPDQLVGTQTNPVNVFNTVLLSKKKLSKISLLCKLIGLLIICFKMCRIKVRQIELRIVV